MSVAAIEQQLQGNPSVSAKEAWVRANAHIGGTEKLSRSDLGRLAELIRGNRRQEAAALLLALALASGANELVAGLRRQGLLRASRYDFKIASLRELVRLLGRLADALDLQPRWIEYLTSVDALYELAADAKRQRDGLLSRLSSRRGRALKSFLVMANQEFARRTQIALDAQSGGLTAAGLRSRLDAEDTATAVSRILALAQDATGLRMVDFAFTDEQALNPKNDTYRQDLDCAFRLDELSRAETLIDGLPYRAQIRGERVVVGSIDPDVEKSVRAGYVQMEMQMLIRRVEMEKIWAQAAAPPMSLTTVFQRYYDDLISRFVEIKDKPIRRITFGIPGIPHLFDPLADDRLFREDFLALLQLDVDDYEDFELGPFDVAPGVQSIDLFRVSRLFALMEHLFQCELAKVADFAERQRLALHSIIAVLRHEQLLAFLGTVLPVETAEKVIELLSWNDRRSFVDLQYTPFLKVDGYYLLAPSLIAHSNLVRNIAFANGLNEKRLAETEEDPMQAAVEEALRDAGFKVGVEVQSTNRSADTDLVAYRDGTLYLIECKNAYHPCNAHEMRNSYEHIRKAGKQLTERRDRFGKTEHLKRIWERLGWDMPAPTRIRTVVLIANRVFTGSSIDGHPVRQAHEFINVVSKGEIRSPDTIYRFWDGDTLTTVDVDRYLAGDGVMGDHFASLDRVDYEFDFGARTLVFESWRYDLLKHHEIVKTRYADRAEAIIG
jgi:hypothetical protein